MVPVEVIGREYLETLTNRPSHVQNQILNNIEDIGQSVGSVDDSIESIKGIHGVYGTGVDSQIASFARNLFGNDPAFTKGVLELENILIEVSNIVDEFEETIDLFGDLNLQDTSAFALRVYLDKVDLVLPDGVRAEIQTVLDELPGFSKLSEQLGGIYNNFVINDTLTNIVDQIIGDVLCETGLSNYLRHNCWVRMLPEYAMHFHDNIRLFQRLGTRVLPKCTYGKIFHIMDEPLAHIYRFAQDAYSFIDFLDNRKAILGGIVGRYRNLIKTLNEYYPLCLELVDDNTPTLQNGVVVDNLGNPLNEVSNVPPTTSVVGLN